VKKMAKKLTLSDVHRKYLKIIAYLLVSGILGYLSANFIAKDPALIAVFAPAINFILFTFEKELKNEGYKRVLTQ